MKTRIAAQVLGFIVFQQICASGLAADSPSTYVPLRQTVAKGAYYPPNYLSTVRGAIDRDSVYQMFSNVVKERYPHQVGKYGKDEILVRALQKQRTQRAQLLGHYAEERFTRDNQNGGWQKVNNRFAPQRDVWRRVDGRIEYAQIKVHGPGKSATTTREIASKYIESMRKDSGRGQARIFLVPDDHVDPIKGLIDERSSAALRRGDTSEATWLTKQRERLAKLGVDFDTLSSEADAAQHAGRSRIVAQYAGPAITVAFISVSAGHEIHRWSSGRSSNAELLMHLRKIGVDVTLGLGTVYRILESEKIVAKPFRLAIRSVIFIAEAGWQIYQHRDFKTAYSSPANVVSLGGNLGSPILARVLSFGGAKLGAVVGTPFGPIGATVGAFFGGFAGAVVGGYVGYQGGAAMTEWMLETFAPEFYYKMKLDQIDRAESKIRAELKRLSDLSQPLSPVRVDE